MDKFCSYKTMTEASTSSKQHAHEDLTTCISRFTTNLIVRCTRPPPHSIAPKSGCPPWLRAYKFEVKDMENPETQSCTNPRRRSPTQNAECHKPPHLRTDIARASRTVYELWYIHRISAPVRAIGIIFLPTTTCVLYEATIVPCSLFSAVSYILLCYSDSTLKLLTRQVCWCGSMTLSPPLTAPCGTSLNRAIYNSTDSHYYFGCFVAKSRQHIDITIAVEIRCGHRTRPITSSGKTVNAAREISQSVRVLVPVAWTALYSGQHVEVAISVEVRGDHGSPQGSRIDWSAVGKL